MEDDGTADRVWGQGVGTSEHRIQVLTSAHAKRAGGAPQFIINTNKKTINIIATQSCPSKQQGAGYFLQEIQVFTRLYAKLLKNNPIKVSPPDHKALDVL